MSDDSIFSDKAWLAEGRRNRSHDPQKVSPQVIPAEAVEAAAKAIASANLRSKSWDALNEEARNHFLRDARAAFEAAAPYMLSHERQQTADAHRDAMVNRETADKLQQTIDRVAELATNLGRKPEHQTTSRRIWQAILNNEGNK